MKTKMTLIIDSQDSNIISLKTQVKMGVRTMVPDCTVVIDHILELKEYKDYKKITFKMFKDNVEANGKTLEDVIYFHIGIAKQMEYPPDGVAQYLAVGFKDGTDGSADWENEPEPFTFLDNFGADMVWNEVCASEALRACFSEDFLYYMKTSHLIINWFDEQITYDDLMNNSKHYSFSEDRDT